MPFDSYHRTARTLCAAPLRRLQLGRVLKRLRSTGMTLIELLVVVAILGVIVSLLLPAVQLARESARRTECSNHLRQLGLATLEYETARSAFPIGCVECRARANPPRFISWLSRLLPYLEEGDIHDQIDFDKPMWNVANQAPTSRSIATLICPSTVGETETRIRASSGLWKERAFTDFGGLYGIEGVGAEEPDLSATQTLAKPFLGVLLYERATRIKDISDGTSKTAFAAEMQLRRVPGECEWANGHQLFAQERSTPVNSASGLGNDIGSPHPGGALAVFCDGHVEWLEESLEQPVLNAMLTRAGGETLWRD